MSGLEILRTVVVTSVVALLAVGSSQESQFQAAYIDSQYLLSPHGIYPQLLLLQDQARSEVSELNARANALMTRRNSGVELTPEENELLSVTLNALQAVTARYEVEIETLLQPAIDEINRLVSETADELGISMVFELSAAFQTGLIVYARPDTDITQLIAEKLVAAQQ